MEAAAFLAAGPRARREAVCVRSMAPAMAAAVAAAMCPHGPHMGWAEPFGSGCWRSEGGHAQLTL